jgi:predicted component of type VI protein secretion system
MPKLVFIDPNFAGKVYSLTIEKTSVGRGDENVLVIRDSSLSARHCEILVNGAEVIVRDLGSRNGTTVNGQLLRNQQSPVKNGQIVRFGVVNARVEIEPGAWSEGTDAETAVCDHRRILRDQRRAQKVPAPGDPSAKLDSAAAVPDGESDPTTILVPEPAPAMNERAINPAGQKTPAHGVAWLWVTLAAAAVLLAAWLIWGRQRG